MSLLVRRLSNGRQWLDLKIANEDFEASNLPPWVFAEFAPRPSDKGWLSFFSAASMDPIDLVGIAGAMSLFSGPSEGAGRQFYVGASIAEIEAIGLSTRKSMGTTKHTTIDDLHWEVEVKNIDGMRALSTLMWSKVAAEIKGAKITEKQKEDAADGLIRFTEAFKSKNRLLGYEDYGVSFIRQGVISLSNC